MKNYIILALCLTLILMLGKTTLSENGAFVQNVSISDASVDFPISQLTIDDISNTNNKLREEFSGYHVYCMFSGGLKIIIISKDQTQVSANIEKKILDRAIFHLANIN